MNSETIAQQVVSSENEVVFDLGRIIGNFWQGFVRFWGWCILLCAVGAAVCVCFVQLTYTPVYDAYASFVVQESISSTQTTSDYSTASRIAQTFQTILDTGVLRSVVERELDLEELTSEITSSSITSTNIVTIHVEDEDPALALAVLNSLMTNYPIVAEYILGATQLEIVDESGIPTQPTQAKNLLLAGLLGAACGVGLFAFFLLVYALSRKTLVEVADLQAPTGISYLTGIPKLNYKKRGTSRRMPFVLYDKKQDPAVLEAFRVLGNAFEKCAQEGKERGKPQQVFLFASTTKAEDKSITAINLACMLAHRKYKVLFLDLNLHYAEVPALQEAAGQQHHLESVLLGQSSLVQAVQAVGRKSTFDWLPAQKGKPQGAIPLLAGEQLAIFLRACRLKYDFIILDTPPLDLHAEATVVAACADAAIFVAKQEVSMVPAAIKMMQQLEETGVPMLGFVMNGVTRDSGRYGYGQGYGNHYYGGYYYKSGYQGTYQYGK